jgi:hypothetical protein
MANPTGDSSVIERPSANAVMAAWVAIGCAVLTLLLLVSLHALSPEFSPAWRMVSEYAYSRYGWILSAMFLVWGISAWALAWALRSQVRTLWGKVGWWLLLVGGLGEAMASVYDINHSTDHSLAGLLGLGGFAVGSVLLSVSLGRLEGWRDVKRPLLWLANLNWVSIVLLGLTLVLMTMQVLHALGSLPTSAPAHLPPGVIGLDGWADRLIVVSNCLWVTVAAWHMVNLGRGTASSLGDNAGLG